MTLACDDETTAREGAPGGTGGACQDYVTPDGFTCCCGKTFCSRTPGCSADKGGGSTGTGGRTSSAGGATTALPNPWIHGDGGIPRSVAIDSSCPSFQVLGYFAVNPPGVGLRGFITSSTAVGCCLPIGVCGAAAPIPRFTQDQVLPIQTFAGWDPPTKCESYSEVPEAPAGPAKSCNYPFDAGAVATDATTASADGDSG